MTLRGTQQVKFSRKKMYAISKQPWTLIKWQCQCLSYKIARISTTDCGVNTYHYAVVLTSVFHRKTEILFVFILNAPTFLSQKGQMNELTLSVLKHHLWSINSTVWYITVKELNYSKTETKLNVFELLLFILWVIKYIMVLIWS